MYISVPWRDYKKQPELAEYVYEGSAFIYSELRTRTTGQNMLP